MKLASILKEIESVLDMSIDDRSNNGLQVGTEKEINKIGFAVDATLETFESAKQKQCDLLITHHGISWGDSLKRITGNNYQRVSYLIKNNLALAAYHLPLDAHEKYGNNAVLASLLDLKKVEPFEVGVKGLLKRDVPPEALAQKVKEITKGEVKLLKHGRELVHSITIVSGSGGSLIEKANADCFIVGDLKYGQEHFIKELHRNVIVAGHYETEVWGLKALATMLKKTVDVECVFISV